MKRASEPLPFAVINRGSGLEPLTPALRAFVTEAANKDPDTLAHALNLVSRLMYGDYPTPEQLARYFTPTQQETMRRQVAQRETESEISCDAESPE